MSLIVNKDCTWFVKARLKSERDKRYKNTSP